MGRRKILLPLAAVIAALGTLMVFMYVQGADAAPRSSSTLSRCSAPSSRSTPASRSTTPPQAGKFQLQSVPKGELLDGYQTDLTGLNGPVATQTIFPGEQITANTWGDQAVAATSLAIPKDMMAISVNLSDPGRVSGFVNPGSEVSVFVTTGRRAQPYAQLMLDQGQGARHRRHVHDHVDHHDQGGRADDRGDPERR